MGKESITNDKTDIAVVLILLLLFKNDGFPVMRFDHRSVYVQSPVTAGNHVVL